MRILVASHLLPSPQAPHAGGQVVFHVLRELAARGHTIDLLTKMLPYERSDLAALHKICSEIITVDSGATRRELVSNIARTGLQHPRRLIRWRGRRNNMLLAQHLDRLLETRQYAVVQLEFVQVLSLVHVVRNRVPVLQVVHDLESKLACRCMQHASRWQRPWRGWLWHAVLQAELRGLDACTAIATFGAFDRNMLRTLLPTKPLIQAPIWLPIGQALPPAPPPPPRLLFVGALWRPVNDQAAHWLLDAIWPRIHTQMPDAELIIAGHGPSPALQAATRRAPNVTLTGRVPDLRAWYVQCHTVIAPVRISGGVLLKVLDAMALGRPVVTTTAGNEGVGAQPGHDLLVEDEPEALAEAVIKVFRSPELAAKLAVNGRRFVTAHFDWRTTFSYYEHFISQLACHT